MKKLTTEEFIKKAIIIHGNNYDYKFVIYISAKNKIQIICNTCNSIFEQSPTKHLHGQGCSYCAGRKINNTNCLLTTHPKICQEWNYEKNDIKPNMITFGSGKKVWWKCKNNHNWSASPNTRINCGNGCPFCSNQKVITIICKYEAAINHYSKMNKKYRLVSRKNRHISGNFIEISLDSLEEISKMEISNEK